MCCPESAALDLYIKQVAMVNPGARVCEQAALGNNYMLNAETFAEAKAVCTVCTCEPVQPEYGKAYLSLPDSGL